MEQERPSANMLKKLGSQNARSGRLSTTGEEKVVYVNPTSLASGGIAEKAAAIFRLYDPGNKNILDHDEMMSALAELGVINGLTSKKLSEILSIGSDKNVGKGRSYNLQEFVSFYERLAHYQAKAARQERIKALSKMPEIPDGMEDNEVLKRVFLNYCKYTVGQSRFTFDEAEPKLSSTQYVKLCQDLGLVQPSGPLNVVTVDVIFHKCKPTGGRRLLFPHYMKALTAAAEESKMNVFELVNVLSQQIPVDAKGFITVEPVMFRSETRSMETSKIKLALVKEEVVAEEPSDSDNDTIPAHQPRTRPKMEFDSSEDEYVGPTRNRSNTKPAAAGEARYASGTRSTGAGGGGGTGPLNSPHTPKDAPLANRNTFGAAGSPRGLEPEVNVGRSPGGGGIGGGGGSGDQYSGDLVVRVDTLEKQMEEVRDGEKLKSEMREDMKKLAKAAAVASTKNIPSIEQRLAACEAKEEALEKGAATYSARLSTLDGKVKQLSEGLQSEVTKVMSGQLQKNVTQEVMQLATPGGQLGKILDTQITAVTASLNDRLEALESKRDSGGAGVSSTKLVELEGNVANQAAKAEQAVKLAQESVKRQVELAPKISSLEASGAEWSKMASRLEEAIRTLQTQVQDLQVKNSGLESEVALLKARGAGEGAGTAAGGGVKHTLVVEQMVGSEAGGVKRTGTADMIAVAELNGRLQGLETRVKENQFAINTALTAVGITPAEATKEGAAVAAASKHAAHEAAVTSIETRLNSVEAKQQEATVTLKKAEAMLSGPAASLAAMNAASAMASRDSNSRKDSRADEEAMNEMKSRVSTLETRHRDMSSTISSLQSSTAGLSALEATVNSKVPHMEAQMQSIDLNTKTMLAKLSEYDGFIASIRGKLPELDSSAQVATARLTELERKAVNMDRATRDLTELVRAVQSEQQTLASSAAMAAQMSKAQGGGGGHGGGVDPAALTLVMATEERLQKHIQTLKDLVNTQVAELDGAKVKYDTNLDIMQATIQSLMMRMNQDGSDAKNPSSGTYARLTELRELEDTLLERVRVQTEMGDKMQRAVNQLIADVERLTASHNASEQARVTSAVMQPRGPGQGGVATESLQLLEQRVEARLALLTSQYVTQEMLRDVEIRFATTDSVRMAVDKARANDEIILSAVKEVDRQLQEKLDVSQQVMLRMARQVDVLQNTMRTAPPPDTGSPSIKIIKPNAAPPSFTSQIPTSAPTAPPGKDPLSILLQQAAASGQGAATQPSVGTPGT